jgi:toxin CcdB
MAQFDVYPNPDQHTNQRIPYLLEIQSNLLAVLKTTVLVPLYDPAEVDVPPVRGLMPVLEFEGRPLVLVTPELTGVPRKRLPLKIGDLRQARETVLAALDILLTGI